MASFALIVEGLLDQKQCNREQAVILGSLRDSLLPKLFSGEIKIDDNNITSAA